MREITVTEALVKINLLKTRLTKITQAVPNLKTICKDDKSLLDNLSKEAFKVKVVAYMNSTKDLLKELRNIKKSIAISNATNTLTIAGTSYTITEAIDRKHTIEFERDVTQMLGRMVTSNNRDIMSIRNDNQKALGASLAEVAATNGNTEAITQEFKIQMYDPLNIEETIIEQERGYEDFMAEVDVQLNLHNATTIISVA